MSILERLLVLYDGLPTPHETVRRAARFLREVAGCDAVSILVHSREKQALVFAVIEGGAAALLNTEIPDGKGVAWWSFRNGFVTVPDCSKDERFFNVVDSSTGFCTRNLVALPFGYQGHMFGVIEMLNFPEGAFKHIDEPLLKVVAGHVGVAYAAADLHQRLAEKSRRLFETNAALEGMVAERTRALEHALNELKKQHDFLQNFQAQLLQTEKMAALGQLAAGVAHEINNPTGFIASNLATARKYWSNVNSYIQKIQVINAETAAAYRERYDMSHIEEDMGRLIEECLEGTSRVTAIVKNLKEFAHQDKGEVAPTNVQALIQRTLSIALSPHKHRIQVRFQFEAPPELKCNGQELGQVILNLVVNAAQAIPGQGVITISASLAEEFYVIEVADTGTGIPEENLSRIFEPFFTTKPVGVGTGLGLSMCYRMVTKAGGDLTVQSRVGVGSTFRISMPLDPEPSPVPSN